VKIPVEEVERSKRTSKAGETLSELRQSYLPLASFYGLKFIGGLPVGLIKLANASYLTSVIFTSFPGPSNAVSYKGLPVTTTWFQMGFAQGSGKLFSVPE
jgi:hypothetical protein